MTLSPGEYFTIARQLNDPSDSGTYYVRAFVRNARTDALIDTINLTGRGDQRFTQEWQVVPDTSGLGLYITITTKVYTDSGYTTLSTVYGIEQHEHLIQDRSAMIWGGGSGLDIDYKRIKKMIDEAVKSRPEPTVDLFPIQTALLDLHEAVKSIHLPEAQKIDLQPILNSLEAIKNKEVSPPDLSPIVNKVDLIKEAMLPQVQTGLEAAHELVLRLKDFFTDDVEKIVKKIDSLTKSINELKAEVDRQKDEEIIKEKKRDSHSLLREYLNGN